MYDEQFDVQQERNDLIHAIRFPVDCGLNWNASVHEVLEAMWQKENAKRGYPLDADEWLIALLSSE